MSGEGSLPWALAELAKEREARMRVVEALDIATRALADIEANGHRRTGAACAGFALTALGRIAGLSMDEESFDEYEP